MFRLVVTLLALTTALMTMQASGTYARSVHAGKSYGCQINPNASICTSGVKASTSGGAVTGVSTTPVSTLPATGGGAPSGSPLSIEVLLIALSSLLLGATGLRVATQRS